MTCRWFIPMEAQRGQHLLNENNVNIYWGGVYNANIDFHLVLHACKDNYCILCHLYLALIKHSNPLTNKIGNYTIFVTKLHWILVILKLIC